MARSSHFTQFHLFQTTWRERAARRMHEGAHHKLSTLCSSYSSSEDVLALDSALLIPKSTSLFQQDSLGSRTSTCLPDKETGYLVCGLVLGAVQNSYFRLTLITPREGPIDPQGYAHLPQERTLFRKERTFSNKKRNETHKKRTKFKTKHRISCRSHHQNSVSRCNTPSSNHVSN